MGIYRGLAILLAIFCLTCAPKETRVSKVSSTPQSTSVNVNCTTHTSSPKMGFVVHPTLIWADLSKNHGAPSMAQSFLDRLKIHGNLVSLHFGDSVPWTLFHHCGQDIENCPGLSSELIQARDHYVSLLENYTAILEANGMGQASLYVALNPLNNDRNGIATSYELEVGTPASSLVNLGSNFGEADLRNAYKNYVRYVHQKLRPQFFSQGIEINMYLMNQPGDFENLKTLLKEIYEEVSSLDSCLKMGPTLQWEFWQMRHDPSKDQIALNELGKTWNEFSNLLFVSTYPHFMQQVNGINPPYPAISNDYYDFESKGIPSGGGLFISEAGTVVPNQIAMLNQLFQLQETRPLHGVVLFFLQDFDNYLLALSKGAPSAALFFNNGLFNDQNGVYQAHPGQARWLELFESPSP